MANHKIATVAEKRVPRTLKNELGTSFAKVVVATAYTPNGNVKPHQPMLNGNRLQLMLASAKNSQTSPNPQIKMPRNAPAL